MSGFQCSKCGGLDGDHKQGCCEPSEFLTCVLCDGAGCQHCDEKISMSTYRDIKRKTFEELYKKKFGVIEVIDMKLPGSE